MKIDDTGFSTEIGDKFLIKLTQESDCSMDGGYSFEDVTNSVELDKKDAKELIKELQGFIDT